MNHRKGKALRNQRFQYLLFVLLLGVALPARASFIESSMGAAVVNDATAVYYNPAALLLLKTPEAIALGSLGHSQTQFNGQSTYLVSNFIQRGRADSELDYFLPSLYFAAPTIKKKLVLGLAIVGNDFNKDIDGHSILRYAQSNNKIDAMDIVPALGLQFNKYLSLGVNLNSSSAHFLLKPVSGLPSLHIPDSESSNESWGQSVVGDIGLLLKPKDSLILGLNYRQAMTYKMHGTSIFYGPRGPIISNDYSFTYWIPARTVFSINHFLTKKLGWIGTLQWIEWSIFKESTIHNLATRAGILPQAQVRYHFHDAYLVTLGLHYRPNSKWIIRTAGSYTQSPSNGRFQIDNGDSLTVGGSAGYTLFKKIIIDGSLAHAFILKTNIHARNAQNLTEGTHRGWVNAVALKVTMRV